MTEPRRFYLQRNTDITGASGTGRVADGILWPDGTATLHWRGDRASTVHWDRIADAEAIHGHSGATQIVWLDWNHEPYDDETPCPHCPDGHGSPTRTAWAARVAPDRDSDGQPTTIHVAPTAGAHVAEEDAEWIRGLLNGTTNASTDPGEYSAKHNLHAFINDLADRGVHVTRHRRTPGHDTVSSYAYDLLLDDGRTISVDMPFLWLEQVRWLGKEFGPLKDFTRIYVNGAAWFWKYALDAIAHYTDTPNEETVQ